METCALINEPILSREDERIWNSWCATAMMHFRSAAHRRRVDQAKRITSACLEAHPNSAVMWSGGKDSTALSHLVAVELGAKVPLVSEKDDLDFDGEESYLQRLASGWDASLEILRPPISPKQWFAEHAHELTFETDIHSRSAGLSKACFYNVVEEDNRKRGAIFLGLRQRNPPTGRAITSATGTRTSVEMGLQFAARWPTGRASTSTPTC